MNLQKSAAWAVFAAALLVSCGPAAPASKSGETSSVELIVQPDGLAYAKGSPTPFTGEVTDFTAALTRQATATWQDGKLHGPSVRYWSSGRIKRQEFYQLGLIHHETQWYEDGGKKQETQAPNASGYRKIQLWWPDGRLRRIALIGDNLAPHGHVLEYAADGILIADAIFDHGQYVSGKIPSNPVAKTVATRAP